MQPVETYTRADGTVGAVVRTDENADFTEALMHAGLGGEEWTVVDVRTWSSVMKDAENQPIVVRNWYIRVKPSEWAKVERLIPDLKVAMEAHAPKYRPVHRAPLVAETFMLEPDLFDLHVGMLSWAEETGANYDSIIARQRAMEAVERLLQYSAGYDFDSILLPIGNDLLHTDNALGTTSAGTRQDVDSRALKMFRAAYMLVVDMIDRLREIAPVRVIVVPGNHDRERMGYMGEVIAGWYRNDPEVAVDNAARLRKYVQYGKTLLGFTHGSEEKHTSLPLIMATEAPEAWATSTHREFHIGHLHKRQKIVTAETHGGVTVRVIPSIIPADAWHFSKGYVGGGRAAEAFVWGKKSGLVGQFTATME